MPGQAAGAEAGSRHAAQISPKPFASCGGPLPSRSTPTSRNCTICAGPARNGTPSARPDGPDVRRSRARQPPEGARLAAFPGSLLLAGRLSSETAVRRDARTCSSFRSRRLREGSWRFAAQFSTIIRTSRSPLPTGRRSRATSRSGCSTNISARQDKVVAALKDFAIVCAMRERTVFPRAVIEALPDLKLLITTGMRNASIDLEAAKARGVVVCGTPAFGNATAAHCHRPDARTDAPHRLREHAAQGRRASGRPPSASTSKA